MSRKYNYLYVIKRFGIAQGWEDVDEVDKHERYDGKSAYSYCCFLLKEYRLSDPTARYRVINRREKRV
jgi:hypothetical protein